MKKTIILSLVALAFFITAVSPIYAAQNSSLLPPWFIDAIKPIQDSINSLIQKIDNHESRIAELEKKVDFEVPTAWSTEFYEVLSPSETKIVMHTSDGFPLTIPTIPPNNCTWNGSIIDPYVTTRAVAHLPSGDIFGVGSCNKITFTSNDIPASGTTFETDIYLWWQGTEKHKTQTITIPNRPFPTWNSLLISPISNGVFTIQGTGALGIGTTSANSIQIDCSSWNCNSDLLRINN